MNFDIVHAADFGSSGGTGAAIRAELKAARLSGLGTAVIPFTGMSRGFVRSFDKRTAELIDDLGIPRLSGDEFATCDILFAHHPQAFERMPASAVRIRPKRVVCVVHHPPFDGHWKPQYDLEIVGRNIDRLFGTPVTFAPVGPSVRAQFDALLGHKPALLKGDLLNMIDLSEWPERRRPTPTGTAVIGRHSRPNPLKWPEDIEEFRAAHPDRRDLVMRVLGGVPAEMESWIGPNWQVFGFQRERVAEFLNSLDFYVYFHSRRWVEAFGMGIAEAMATGLVTIVHPSFEALFQDGAVYAEPHGVADAIDRLLKSPDLYSQQSAKARKLVEAKFSLANYPSRMDALCDDLGLSRFPALKPARPPRLPNKEAAAPPRAHAASVPRVARRRRILFVATNGIGLGHITRLMAIAERMSGDVEPVFFTRSAGFSLLHQRGHATDYIPWSVKMGVTEDSWNQAYAQELLATIENLDIAAVVFDGTYPFRGLLSVQASRPDLAWVWIRRGLWVDGQHLEEELQAGFDIIVEPGDLAQDEDHGPTSRMPGIVQKVPTILLLDPDKGLDRAAAAARLNTDPDRFTVAMQLGSQRNFDFDELPQLLVEEVLRRGLQFVRIENPLAPQEARREGIISSNRYPVADCFAAIDCMITNAGYNSFHECIHGGMPAIFVPNEAPEMDDQQLRAAYAHATGLGLRLRASEPGNVGDTLDIALSEDFRTELKRRSARLDFVNGASEAARIIEDLVFSVKNHAPLHASVPRA